MNKKRYSVYGLLLAMLAGGTSLQAFAPVNFFSPENSLARVGHIPGSKVKLGAYVEAGARSRGYGWDGANRNLFTLHDPQQRAAHMLLNPTSISDAHAGYVAVAGDGGGAVDGILFNGGNADFQHGRRGDAPDPAHAQRGAAAFEGSFAGAQLTLHAATKLSFVKIPGSWFVELYLPTASKRVRNVQLADKTQGAGVRIDDAKAFNANLASNMMEHFGQDLSATNVNGVGDVAGFLNWAYRTEVEHDYFKELCVLARVGLSAPSGTKSSAHQPFRMPLGHDGSWTLPFALHVKGEFFNNLLVGLAFDAVHQFDNTMLRRVKTSPLQSEFMLINQARVRKEYGFTYSVSPYLQFQHFIKGMSFKLAYQHTAHGSDSLRLKDRGFEARLAAHLDRGAGYGNSIHSSEGITPAEAINSANSLKKWDVHNIFMQLSWDVADSVADAPGAPQLALFFKVPISGRNVVATNVLGGHLAFNF